MSTGMHPGGLEILGPLGRGGTAEVVRVYDPELKRECALKQPLKSAPVSEQLFRHLAEREYNLIGGLSYPGIITVYRAALDAPSPYILIELCRGRTMQDLGWSGNLVLSLNVLTSVAVSLEYLRLHGLVHGDIKPHNIFLPLLWRRCDRSDLFYPKLADFSMGRRDDEPESARAGRGTVGYMAPETIDGAATTHRSDLFSYGVMAYWFLSGEHPFLNGETDPIVINARVQEDDPSPLHEVNQEIPEAVSAVVQRLLAKDPSDRYVDAWSVARDLVEAGATYPIERALQPRHVVTGTAVRESIDEFIRLDERLSSRLAALSNDDCGRLRLLLGSNFRRGNMRYEPGQFVWQQPEVYLPPRLRRQMLAQFSSFSLSMKRRVILAAVVGSCEAAHASGLLTSQETKVISSPLVDIMRPLLSQALVKRYSAALAPLVREKSDLVTAARLYCQAGLLQDAVDSILAAYEKSAQPQTDRNLIGSMNLVIDLAGMSGHLFAARRVLLAKAECLKKTGQTTESLACFDRIFALYDDVDSDAFLASAYKALGDLHKARQSFDDGLAALSTAMDIYQELGDELEISHTYNNIGNIYWVGSDLASALLNYRRALRIQRRLGATADIASTINNIGSMYGMGGRYQRAINLYQLSIGLKQELGDEPEIARTLNNLGYVYHLTGRNDQAVEVLSQSLEINERHGTRREVLINLHNLLEFTVAAGQLDSGLSYAHRALDLAAELKDTVSMAAFKSSEAEILVRLGRYDEVRAAYEQAKVYFKGAQDFRMEMLLEMSRVQWRLGIGDRDETARLLATVLNTCREKNEASVTLKALQLSLRLHDDDALYEEALKLARSAGSQRDIAVVEWNRIGSLMESGRPVEAKDAAMKHVKLIESMTQDIDYARVCCIAGEVLTYAGHTERAAKLLESGYEFAQRHELLPELIVAQALSGRVQLASNEFEAAYRSYRGALATCKEIASHISSEADRQQFQNRRIVQFLVGEIKRLQQLFAQKNRQVGTPA